MMSSLLHRGMKEKNRSHMSVTRGMCRSTCITQLVCLQHTKEPFTTSCTKIDQFGSTSLLSGTDSYVFNTFPVLGLTEKTLLSTLSSFASSIKSFPLKLRYLSTPGNACRTNNGFFCQYSSKNLSKNELFHPITSSAIEESLVASKLEALLIEDT